jgi:broad specificity phosphatase PhoE
LTICYLIRHGTTAWVNKNLLHGATDIPLNDNGINQAKETAKALSGIKADFLFSSPLSRAFQTAEIIGRELNLVPVSIEEVREMNFGWMEGKKVMEEFFDRKPSIKAWFYHNRENIARAISGETKKRFARRVLQGWQKIQDQSRDRNFVLVVHAGVINVILRYYFDTRYATYKKFYSIDPASITEVSISKSGKADLVRLNDYAHLKA